MRFRVFAALAISSACSSSPAEPKPPEDPEPVLAHTVPAPDAGQEVPDKISVNRDARYPADPAHVYTEVLAIVRDAYPHFTEDAGAMKISTAWHPRGKGASGDLYFVRVIARVFADGGGVGVAIEAEAARWTTGAVPVPLSGADEPPWVAEVVDELHVAVAERLAP